MSLCPEYWPILPPCFGSWPLQPHQQYRYNRKTRKLLQKLPSSILSSWSVESKKQMVPLEGFPRLRSAWRSSTSLVWNWLCAMCTRVALPSLFTSNTWSSAACKRPTLTPQLQHERKQECGACESNRFGDRFRKHQSATHKPHSRCTTWTKKLFGIAVVFLSILPFHLFPLRLILLLLLLLLFFLLLF